MHEPWLIDLISPMRTLTWSAFIFTSRGDCSNNESTYKRCVCNAGIPAQRASYTKDANSCGTRPDSVVTALARAGVVVVLLAESVPLLVDSGRSRLTSSSDTDKSTAFSVSGLTRSSTKIDGVIRSALMIIQQ